MFKFLMGFCLFSQFSWATHPFFRLEYVDDKLTFQSKLVSTIEITAFRVYFFSHPSCYQGYMQDIQMTTLKKDIVIQPQHFLSLSPTYILQLARQVLNEEEFKRLRAILIQLKIDARTFISFDGSCADQGINCCVALDCSQGKSCDFLQQYGTQFLL